MHAFCALAMAGAETVGPGIATTDDEDALAGGEDCGCGVDVVAFVAAVLLRQELHGVVDAFEFAAFNFEVTWLFCSAGEEDRVVVAGEGVHGNVATDVRIRQESDAFGA